MPKKSALFLTLFSLLLYNSLFAQSELTKSNLPIVVIETGEDREEFEVSTRMKVINNGKGQLNNIEDPADEYEGPVEIQYKRGRAFDIYPKRSFEIKTINEEGDDINVALLGLPKDSEWLLYAPYSDKSLLRNVLTFHLGNMTGHYAPRAKYCELILNGEYQGIYVMMEKIKRNKRRVNINKLEANENEGDDLTGGYIIKIDKLDSVDNGWYSSFKSNNLVHLQSYSFRYEYPDQHNITDQQKKYIKGFIDQFETTLNSENFNDAINGYSKYIDVPSFIDHFLITELCKNIDGYRLGEFFYKKKDSEGGKLHAGPIWDSNVSYGNANYCQGNSPAGWAMDFNNICPEDKSSVPFWWRKLNSDPLFSDRVLSRWLELRETFLITSHINKFIDSTAHHLEEAQQRNFMKWPVIGAHVWPNAFVGHSYEEEVAYLKSWIRQRIDWMDQNLDKISATEQEAEKPMVVVFPNPFQHELTFLADSFMEKKAVIKIYDVFGKTLATLNSSKKTKDGRVWIWNGTSEGKVVNDGSYFYTLEAGGKIITSHMIQKSFN